MALLARLLCACTLRSKGRHGQLQPSLYIARENAAHKKKERERGRKEGQLRVRPKLHDAAAAPCRKLTDRAVFSAGPASLVASLLAIVPVLDKGSSFRARPRRCRRKEKGRSTMSNTRHTSPPSLFPSPLLNSNAVMASLSAICKALCILPAVQDAHKREQGRTTQG